MNFEILDKIEKVGSTNEKKELLKHFLKDEGNEAWLRLFFELVISLFFHLKIVDGVSVEVS